MLYITRKEHFSSSHKLENPEISKERNEEILAKVDHKFLNETELFKDVIPTTENMAVKFWEILEKKVKRDNVRLYSIRLYETEKNYVEYRGE